MQLTKAILALALVVSPILAAPTDVGEEIVNTNLEARAVSSSYSQSYTLATTALRMMADFVFKYTGQGRVQAGCERKQCKEIRGGCCQGRSTGQKDWVDNRLYYERLPTSLWGQGKALGENSSGGEQV